MLLLQNKHRPLADAGYRHGRNRLHLLCLLLLLAVPGKSNAENDRLPVLTIAEAFIEMRTGPGEAYPVFHILERGEKITILTQKTGWYKIRPYSADTKQVGWVSKQQIQKTLLPDGEQPEFTESNQHDFTQRQWELGATAGKFKAAPILSVYGSYLFNENVAAEITLAHSVASVSSSNIYKINLLIHPFPQWRVSPYLTLGAGGIQVIPDATLINPADKNSPMSQAGLGVKTYVSRQFLIRAEYNQYIIFSANNTNDTNEDIAEWKIGFAIFF